MRWRVAGAVGVGLGLWMLWGGSTKDPDVTNQAWTERFPTGPKDEVTWLFLLEDGGERFGMVRRLSDYRIRAERFRFTRQADRFRLEFPQTGHRTLLKARAYTCSVGDWELCLDLEESGRKATFYSMKDWTLGHPDTPPFDARPVREGCDPCSSGMPAVLGDALDP